MLAPSNLYSWIICPHHLEERLRAAWGKDGEGPSDSFPCSAQAALARDFTHPLVSKTLDLS